MFFSLLATILHAFFAVSISQAAMPPAATDDLQPAFQIRWENRSIYFAIKTTGENQQTLSIHKNQDDTEGQALAQGQLSLMPSWTSLATKSQNVDVPFYEAQVKDGYKLISLDDNRVYILSSAGLAYELKDKRVDAEYVKVYQFGNYFPMIFVAQDVNTSKYELLFATQQQVFKINESDNIEDLQKSLVESLKDFFNKVRSGEQNQVLAADVATYFLSQGSLHTSKQDDVATLIKTNFIDLNQKMKPEVAETPAVTGPQKIKTWSWPFQKKNKKDENKPLDLSLKSTLQVDEKNPGPKGIDLLKLIYAKKAELLRRLQAFVFGQNYVLERLAEHYADALANGMKKPKVLVAMGPSGTGKSYTAELLAELISEKNVLKISGNEYNAHAGALDSNRLFGSKLKDTEGLLPAYAQSHRSGFVFIIDEGEKMNPDIWKRLMEFFDTGCINDIHGETIRVKNLWVVITSNRGALKMFPPATSKTWNESQIQDRTRSLTQEFLKNYFSQTQGVKDEFTLPPEILNRVEEFLVFAPLSEEAVKQIIQKQLVDWNLISQNKFQLQINFDPALLQQLAQILRDQANDARSLERKIRLMLNSLRERSVKELQVKTGDVIQIHIDDSGITNQGYQATCNGASFLQEPITLPELNPILNPDLRHRLLNIEPLLKKVVFGQDDTIGQLVEPLFSQFSFTDVKKPFSAFFLGVSGNGKTELGRAISQVVWGNDTSYRILPMSEVQEIKDMDKIFGWSSKYVGGGEPSPFEAILNAFPNGATIIFDEMSSVGGGDLKQKEAIFKRMLNMLEEGFYTSPMNHRIYDLSKYQFIFTGNDGQELFEGFTSDEMLMDIYKDNKNPQKVRKLLRRAGLTDAVLNRFSVAALTKPLLKSEARLVSNKLWQRVQDAVAKDYRGAVIEPDADLLNQLTDTYFTADQGARGVRKVLEEKIKPLIARSLLDSCPGCKGSYQGYTVKVSLSDNKPKLTYLIQGFKRSVKFNVEVYNSTDKLVYREIKDETQFVPSLLLQNLQGTRATAFHEVGHGIVRDVVSYMTILPGGTQEFTYYGYAREINENENLVAGYDRDKIVEMVATLYAGQLAQQEANYTPDTGWTNDIERIRKLANNYAEKWALHHEFIALPMDKNGDTLWTPDTLAKKQLVMEQIINEGKAMALTRIRANWPLVLKMVDFLIEHGEIGPKDFKRLVAEAGGLKRMQKPEASAIDHLSRPATLVCSQVLH